MLKQLFVLLSVVLLCQASVLVIEEGTANEDDWRQLSIELPPGTFNNEGELSFTKPSWIRREGDTEYTFYVLGSLVCPADSDQSVAARIDGEWICVDINDARLPPTEEGKRLARSLARATEGRVDPPTCTVDMSTALWQSPGVYTCGHPDGLIQSVTNPERPECQDTDLVVFNEEEDWFECKRLNEIRFASTISTDDFRWQTPSTTRHIGGVASTGSVRSGSFNNFKWTNYAFTASSELTARDQTSPPEVVNSGGAFWVAFSISTTFVDIGGVPPYETFDFYPLDPGSSNAHVLFLEGLVAGSTIRGTSLTFQPVLVEFSSNGENSVEDVDELFVYDSSTAANGYAIKTLTDLEVDSGQYPALEIARSVSDFFVGSGADFNPYLSLTMTMWLQYVAPSGF